MKPAASLPPSDSLPLVHSINGDPTQTSSSFVNSGAFRNIPVEARKTGKRRRERFCMIGKIKRSLPSSELRKPMCSPVCCVPCSVLCALCYVLCPGCLVLCSGLCSVLGCIVHVIGSAFTMQHVCVLIVAGLKHNILHPFTPLVEWVST